VVEKQSPSVNWRPCGCAEQDGEEVPYEYAMLTVDPGSGFTDGSQTGICLWLVPQPRATLMDEQTLVMEVSSHSLHRPHHT